MIPIASTENKFLKLSCNIPHDYDYDAEHPVTLPDYVEVTTNSSSSDSFGRVLASYPENYPSSFCNNDSKSEDDHDLFAEQVCNA